MTVLVDTIRISGFRGIKNLEMSLPRVTVLVGTNNSGKTSVLKAMQLALGDYSRYLAEEDFHISADENRVKQIIVDVRIVPAGDDGNRTQSFDDEWASEFGDKIQAESDGNQFVAIRTRAASDAIKGDFGIERCTLEKWPDRNAWQTESVKETKMHRRFESMPFFSIEAQRDIHQELKEKASFVGRVLSSVEYSPDDVEELERLIKELNDDAVGKSTDLQRLRTHLDDLNQSFQGSGNTEITPFPKKIRDLSKHFSIHFGESAGNAFSMEYHGMGTRSWASMLTVRAFVELMAAKHRTESKPYFPIIAAEEPEAHLHPNAQKTIYGQLVQSNGQVIISTHSPYLAAIADQSELRYLKSSTDGIEARQLSIALGTEEHRRIEREIMHSRGEIIFSKVLVLCEGETEAQALPTLFRSYMDCDAFVLGVNFIGVGGSGKKYLPFLTFARDLSIPVFVFSDGEETSVKDLKKYWKKVFGEVDIVMCPQIVILYGTNWEGYLISSGFKATVESAIKVLDGAGAIDDWINKKHGTSSGREMTDSPHCATCKQPIFADVLRDYDSSGGHDRALMEMLSSDKTRYAPAVAVELCKLKPEDFPPKIIELFERIKTGAE